MCYCLAKIYGACLLEIRLYNYVVYLPSVSIFVAVLCSSSSACFLYAAIHSIWCSLHHNISVYVCVCACVVSYKLRSNTRAVTKIMFPFPKTVLRLFSKPKTRPSGNIHSRPMIQPRWTRARRKTSRCVWCAWHLAPGIKRESWFMFCSFLDCLSFFRIASIQLLSDEPHSMANI